ncbi:hypothetical protein KEM52_006417 [Ascosphaera acerosa]|nr:hypothetical protein KEM52_006417 [Ascosphaera acerosa]
MDDSQRLVIASTWSFSPDAASDIRDKVSGTASAGGGFVHYDRTNDAFIVEHCNSQLAASGLGALITDTIEAEEADDLLKVPNITRLDAVNGLDDPDEIEEEAQETLLDTSAALAHHVTSFIQKSWEPRLSNSVAYLSSHPLNALEKIQSATHTTLSYDDKNTRVVVSGHNPRDVDRAVQKLSALEPALVSQSDTPSCDCRTDNQ